MADASPGVTDFGQNPGIKRPDANEAMGQPDTPFQRGLKAGMPLARAKAARFADPRFVYRVDDAGAADLLLFGGMMAGLSLLTVPGIGLVTKFLIWGKLASYNVSLFEMYRGTKKNKKRMSAKAQKELDARLEEFSKKDQENKSFWDNLFNAGFSGFLTSLVIENIPVVNWWPAELQNIQAIVNESRNNDRLEQRFESWSGWYQKREAAEKAQAGAGQDWRMRLAAGVIGANRIVTPGKPAPQHSERLIGNVGDMSAGTLQGLAAWDQKKRIPVDNKGMLDPRMRDEMREQRILNMRSDQVDGVRDGFDQGRFEGLAGSVVLKDAAELGEEKDVMREAYQRGRAQGLARGEGVEGATEDYAGFAEGKTPAEVDGVNRNMYELVGPAEPTLKDLEPLVSQRSIGEQAKQLMRQKMVGGVVGEAKINPELKRAMRDMRLMQGVTAPRPDLGGLVQQTASQIRTGDLMAGRQIPVYGANTARLEIRPEINTTIQPDQGIRAAEARRAWGDWVKSSPDKLKIIVDETFDTVPPDTWGKLLLDRTAARTKLDELTRQAIERMDTESDLHLRSSMQDLIGDVGTRLRGREFKSLDAMKDGVMGAIEDSLK